MNKNEPKNHHYIPRFILKRFADENGYVDYFDNEFSQKEYKTIEEVFSRFNFYRNDKYSPSDPVQIENDFSKLEGRAAKIFENLLTGDTVFLPEADCKFLKYFFALMGFRSIYARNTFRKEAKTKGNSYNSKYYDDKDPDAVWVRNLSILAKYNSVEEVFNSKELDLAIKIFIQRDTENLTGTYFVLLNATGKRNFVISDCYPVVITGDNNLHLYSIFPISKNRMLLLCSYDVGLNPKTVTGFNKDVFKSTRLKGDSYKMNVNLVPDKIVDRLNKLIIKESFAGYIETND